MIVHVHGGNVGLTEALSSHINRSLQNAVDRFESRIERVRVTLDDQHGLKHGQTLRCHVVLTLRRRGTVVVDQIDSDCYAAVDLAMGRLKRAVRRRINRGREAHRHEIQRGVMANLAL